MIFGHFFFLVAYGMRESKIEEIVVNFVRKMIGSLISNS